MSTNLIIALIAICLFFSALLSGSETAITYVPREKIHQLSDSKRNNKIKKAKDDLEQTIGGCLLYTSPSPRDVEESRMPSSA